MTWDKPITADGCTATPEQLQAAWGLWLQRNDGTMSSLSGLLPHSGADGVFFDRLADRMLQKARKAGVIRFVKGKWELV